MDDRLTLTGTKLPGVVVATSHGHADGRGGFTRWFCERELSGVLGEARIAQVNHSWTRMAGTVRGLHFQHPPFAETKMVRCIRGSVFDVAVDLRAGSPSFLAWHAEELSAANQRMLIVPPGCAHGFQTLSDDCELLYLHTAPYVAEAEGAIAWDEPRIGVNWPMRVELDALSPRDRNHPRLPASFAGIAP